MKSFYNTIINLKAFTLIELMATIGVLAILSTIAVFTFTRSNPERLLNLTAENIIGQLQQAQSLAFTGAIESSTISVPNGYGVFIDAGSQYKIYADSNSTGIYDGGDIIIGEVYNIDTSKITVFIKTYQNADFSGITNTVANVNIFFPVPRANFLINDQIFPLAKSSEIILTDIGTTMQKIIKIRTDSYSFNVD